MSKQIGLSQDAIRELIFEHGSTEYHRKVLANQWKELDDVDVPLSIIADKYGTRESQIRRALDDPEYFILGFHPKKFRLPLPVPEGKIRLWAPSGCAP